MATATAFTPFPASTFALRLAHLGAIVTLTAAPLVMSTMTARSFEAVKAAVIVPLALLIIPGLLVAPGRKAIREAAGAAPAAFAAVAVLLLTLAASTFLSETPWIALFGSYFRREGFVTWLTCGALFTYLAATTADGPQLRLLLRIAAATSIVPCAYALMQRFGHDFFITGDFGSSAVLAARPGGTFGNPSYLGGYLVMMIPVSLQGLLTESRRPARGLWAGLLAVQLACIAFSQSRGPLVGLAVALVLLAIVAAAAYRSRRLVLCLIGLLIACIALIAAIWLVPAVHEWLRSMPLTQRWLAPATVSARIEIWHLGIDVVFNAPPLRRLLGYGPDAANFAYYPHIPYGPLMAVGGYFETLDRLHNDLLDLSATGGLLGATAYTILVSSLVFYAARQIFALQGPRRAAGFAAVSALSAIAAACVVVRISGANEWIPAALGLGMAGGWVLFFAWHAGRSWYMPRASHPPDAAPDRLLVGALAAGLIGYWVDSQVSVPTFATRVIFFSMAGILLGALRKVPDTLAEHDASGPPAGPCAATTLSCAAAGGTMLLISSFFPADYGTVIDPPVLHGGGEKLLVIALFLGACLAFFRFEAATLHGTALRLTARIAGPVSVFALVYCAIAWTIAHASSTDLDLRLAALPGAAVVAAVLSCLGFAAHPGRRAARIATPTPANNRAALAALAATGVLVVVAAIGAFREIRADILSKLAAWSYANGRTEQAREFLDRAAALLPREKQYRLASGTRRLEQAALLLTSPAADGQLEAKLDALLDQAENTVRAALEQAPRDPWVVLALANVLQFRALSILRPGIGALRGAAAAAEARELFARAHALFPALPLVLRNWAQFEFDQGNAARAYALLDKYEQLDPYDRVPYVERLRFAVATRDAAEIQATLQRAERHLDPVVVQYLKGIASLPSTR